MKNDPTPRRARKRLQQKWFPLLQMEAPAIREAKQHAIAPGDMLHNTGAAKASPEPIMEPITTAVSGADATPDSGQSLPAVAAPADALARLKADMALRYASAHSPVRQSALTGKSGAPRDAASKAPAGGPARNLRPHDGHPAFLLPGALHDIFAASEADGPAAHGFVTGHAIRMAAGRPVVWIFHDMVGRELGRPNGEGLSDMGLAPRDLLLVRVRNAQELLTATEEAARHPSMGVVMASLWGDPKAFDLTASRRLALAASRSGVAILCARLAATPAPGAAWSRWSVKSVASRPLEGGAPGHPAFSITLLRHRGGAAPAIWTLEWDRAQRSFSEPAPLSGAMVSIPAIRPPASPPDATPDHSPNAGPGQNRSLRVAS